MMSSSRDHRDIRVCVCGGKSVGKSAITVRFLTRRFIGEYQSNVQHAYKGSLPFGSEVIDYEITDTTDDADLTFITDEATCLAVVYSIVDRKSFELASEILFKVNLTLQHTQEDTRLFPLALVANKNDLGHFRRIPKDEGRDMASKYRASFWEVSASEDYNSVAQALHSLIVDAFAPNSSTKVQKYVRERERVRKHGNRASVSKLKPQLPNILITAQREVILTSSLKRMEAVEDENERLSPVLNSERGDQRMFFDNDFDSKTRRSVRRKISSMFRPRSFTSIEE